MNARLFANTTRKPATPHPYQTTGDVTGKARASDCPHCNPTARAIQIVLARWVVAGIDKGE